ncbi:unnamed protein product [Cunninghamella blakesleeana]
MVIATTLNNDDSLPIKTKSTATPTCLVAATRFIYEGSEFEYSIHSPGSRFGRELGTVFPSLTIKQRREILVIPVIQRCEFDMVGITQHVNKERMINWNYL